MNKKRSLIVGGVAAAVIVVGGGAWWFFSQPKSNTQTEQPNQSTSLTAPKEACNYLTDPVAVQVLGAGAEKGAATPDVKSDDVNVSTCTYTSKPGTTVADVKNIRAATLLVRSPLTATGAESNEEPFNNVKTGAIGVAGYGEQAFWDPGLGQLNVLKGGVWLIISLGKATTLSDHSIDETKALADLIVPQF